MEIKILNTIETLKKEGKKPEEISKAVSKPLWLIKSLYDVER